MVLILEYGMAHLGNIKLAHDLLYAAREAGALLVKGQLYDPYTFLPKNHFLSDKKKEIKDVVESWPDIIAYAHQLGLRIGFSIWSEAYWYVHKHSDFIKISAKQIDNIENLLPYLEVIKDINENKKPLFVSMREDQNLTNLKVLFNDQNPIFLPTISKYPTDFNEMKTLIDKASSLLFKEEYWGVSSHVPNVNIAYYASKKGASFMEAHFCLDKNYSTFRDYASSLDFDEVCEIISNIDNKDHEKSKIIFN